MYKIIGILLFLLFISIIYEKRRIRLIKRVTQKKGIYLQLKIGVLLNGLMKFQMVLNPPLSDYTYKSVRN